MADEEEDNPIIRIANQADDIFKQRGRRWDTYFYKVVLAGNVKAIKQVVSHLESKGSTETLDWLFKRNKFEEMDHVKRKKSKRLLGVRGIIFIVLSLVNLIVTPFFYALHMLSTSLLNRKQRRISASIRLPLAYAAFSQEHEMVVFFLSQGVDIDHIDQRGNNIFHYISDLSAVSPDTAIQIFQTAVKEIDDRDSVKKLLEQDRNSAGFTAVEYAAKFGSPSLLTQILSQPNLLHHTPFVASKDQVKFMKEDDHVETNLIGARTRVEVVDVSMYEGGRLTDQSTLLNILSDRDIARMSSIDLEIFDDVQLIGRWLILKCKQMLCGVMVLHVIDLILTCLMMYVLAKSFIGRNGVDFEAWTREAYRKVQLDEISAWTKSESSMFKKHAFDELVHKVRVDKQRLWFDQLLDKDPNTTRLLLNASSLDPMVEQALLDGEHNISTDRLSESMDILYEHVMKMPELSNATTNLMIARSFSRIIEELAKELLARKDEFLHGLNNVFEVRSEFYTNFSIEVDKNVISPFQFLELWDIFEFLCPPTIGRQEDLKFTFSSVTFEDIKDNSFDLCIFYAIANTIENRTCKATKTVLQIYHYSIDRQEGIDRLFHVIQFVITCAYLYIFLDMVERCIFLTKSVVYQTSPQDMIITALGQKVPGSYVRKQLNVFSCLAVIIQYHFHEFIRSHYLIEHPFEANEFYASASYIAMVFIVAIVVRFLMHIHSLRLLPGIGHFVITTFMMGTNLLHFSAVFGIVLLIFSTLFHILIDDPDCPLEKSEGFVSMQDSLFSTFKLTFAHGDMEPFFTSAPVQLTYVLYVIIVGLLLLNLIIAIMSSTATEIMADPWKEVLWKVEWLDEATSAEYTMSILTLPFRKLTGRGHFSHKKAGYIVKKLPDDKYKIYIECFQCAALRD